LEKEVILHWKKREVRLTPKMCDALSILIYVKLGWRSAVSGVREIKKLINQYNFSPEDIGTTKKELIQLEKEGYKKIAISILEECRRSVREGKKNFDSSRLKKLTTRIKNEAKKAGITLEDFGTSEQELQDLKRKIQQN